MPLNACIYGGVRTPFGKYGGALAALRPDDMAAQTINALREKLPMPTGDIEDIILGCSNQGGEDSRNIARNAAILSGLPVSTPGQTVNRLCASGLAAVWDAARAVSCGEGLLYLAGGAESMSRAPIVMNKAGRAYAQDIRCYDSTLGSRFPNPRFLELFGDDTLSQTADNIARELGISREEADTYALRSQRLYASARRDGHFADEIIPVAVPVSRKSRAGQVTTEVREDEHPRPDSTLEALRKLRALNKDGVTTAGNASGLNDGCCVLWVGSPAEAEKTGRGPLARILSCAAAGVPPRVMGLGPVPAIGKALERAGLSLHSMDLIEINEAFAAQILGCLKRLGVAFDDPRVNPCGGAIAVGHPLGASGARLALSGARYMRRNNLRYGLVSLCVGLGQGLAMVLENPEW